MIPDAVNTIKKHTAAMYVLLAAFQLLFMFYQCGKQSMWLDEMSFLGTITKDKSFTDILWQYLAVDVTNLPLFPLIAAVWYRLLPANDRIMLLLPEIFTAGALVMTGLMTEKCFGKKAGITAAVLMLISRRCVLNCGFELRSYGAMLFLSALLLYIRFDPDRQNDRKQLILYGTAMTLLLYTHYSGAILTAVLGCIDVVEILCKQKKPVCLIPYFGAGALFLPWFAAMLFYKQKSIGSFWTKPPTIPEISRTLKYLLSENEPVFVIFLIAVLITVFRLIYGRIADKKTDPENVILTEMTAMIFIMITAVFVYSAFINPGGGFFLKRYFIVLMPPVIAVTSFGAVTIQNFLAAGRGIDVKYSLFFVFTTFILLYFGFINLAEIRKTSGSSWETFREAAEYVREQGIAEDEGNIALVCSVNPRATAGFAEYYVRRGGKDKETDTVSLQGEDPVKGISGRDRLYLVYVHRDLEELDKEISETLEREYKLAAMDENVKAAVYERKGK